MGVAWALAAHVSDALVRLVVGMIGLSFVVYIWLGRVPKEPRQPSAASGVFWGGVSGFISTLAQAGAPPFQIYMLPQKLDRFRGYLVHTIVTACQVAHAVANKLQHFTGQLRHPMAPPKRGRAGAAARSPPLPRLVGASLRNRC